MPTKTEKNASVDAFDLVKRLTLPKITVRDSSVSTLLGDDVAVFINGIPASTDEMRGIDVSTISKVEYLDFPQDSRYLGCQHVLNITTKLPIAGGFTKIYARGDYADKLTEYANIMSKFSYKRMIYDVILTQQFKESDKIGSRIDQYYRFSNGNSITQNQSTINGYYNLEKYGGTFRAIYNTQNVMISNMIGLTRKSTPNRYENIQMTIPGISYGETAHQHTSDRTLSPAWIGNYYFALPKNFSLTFQGEASYTHNNYDQSKKVEELFIFDNQVKEDAYKIRSNVTIQKNMNRAGMLNLTAIYWYTAYNMDYVQEGILTNQYERNESVNATLSYSIPIKNFMLYAGLGATYRFDKISGNKHSYITPAAYLMGSWNKDRHSAQFNIDLGQVTYDGAYLNSTPLQTDNYMFVKGNPDLKFSPRQSFTGYYGYSFSNTLQLSVFGKYEHISRLAILDYIAETNYVFATRVNAGNFQNYLAALQIGWRPLKGSLSISITPMITGYKLTGLGNNSTSNFKLNAEVFYYLKNWNFGLFYYGKEKSIANSGITSTSPAIYGLQVGWGNESWNVAIGMGNLFSKDWYNVKSSLRSENYSFESSEIGPTNTQRNFTLTVAYTIGYGKKTSRETIENLENSSSAILR